MGTAGLEVGGGKGKGEKGGNTFKATFRRPYHSMSLQ